MAAEEFVDYLDKNFGIYPLWLCPLRQKTTCSSSTFSSFAAIGEQHGPETFLNVGIWGVGPKGWDRFVEANRDLEQKVHKLKGKKWLYAHTYYTEDEFWNVYDRAEYDALREKYHANYLPSVYDKVKVDIASGKKAINRSWRGLLYRWFWSIWPLRGLYGLFHAAVGGDYLLPRKKTSIRK